MGNKNKYNDNNVSNDEMMKEIKEESIVIDDEKKTEEILKTEEVTKEIEEVKPTKLEDNQYKVSCGRFADEKNTIYEFGEVVTLTKKQVERYTKLNIIGNQLRK